MRILVTGSRKYQYRSVLSARLADAAAGVPPDQVTVVHGNNGNADMMADGEARAMMFHVEPHDADWTGPCRSSCKPGHRERRKDGTEYCPAAGNYRNQEMVDAGADVCLAFYQPHAANIGTNDCVNRCLRAGIKVRAFGKD